MENKRQRIVISAAAWTIVVATILAAAAFTRASWPWPTDDLPLALGLLAATTTLTVLASARLGGPGVRLAQVPLLAAICLLPPPSGVWIAMGALVAARGSGVAGLRRSGAVSAAATLFAVGAAQTVDALLRAPTLPFEVPVLPRIVASFLLLQPTALALGLLLDRHRPASDEQRRWLWIETVSIPLAWILTGLIGDGVPGPALTFLVVLVLAQVALVALSRAMEQSRRSASALASRIAELDTLHAIGREILSSLDPDRVARVIERECRKVFDVDVFTILLAGDDRSGLGQVYRWRRGGNAEKRPSQTRDGLTAWVVEEKRGLRVADVAADARASTLGSELLDASCRSILAVPLVVEDRVIGMLLLQSRRPAAYDEHALSLLTTVAQQAAVALENARHYEMATVDSLTRFYLRDYFFRRLEDEYRRVRRYGGTFSVLMVDLDGFKDVNDRHGHLAGDRYLREVSRAILEQLRAADLGCRYGGDEFCLLLPETDLEGAKVIAERIRGAVSRTVVNHEGAALRTTASIGIAAFPEHEVDDVNALLRNADEALYRAKRRGRDCVVPFAA